MTNNDKVTATISDWTPPKTHNNELTGKRVHDLREQLGDGTVLDYDAVEALVKYDALPEPVWTMWGDIDFA